MQTHKELFIWTELPILLLINESNIIFNIYVNRVFAINMIVHNSLTQTWNTCRLKFWDLLFLREHLLIDVTKDYA